MRSGKERGGDDVDSDLVFPAGGNLKSGPRNLGTCATFAEMTFSLLPESTYSKRRGLISGVWWLPHYLTIDLTWPASGCAVFPDPTDIDKGHMPFGSGTGRLGG